MIRPGVPRFGLFHAGLSRTSRFLLFIGIVIVTAIGGATAWLVLEQRADHLVESQRSTSNLAVVLAEQTSRVIQPVDLTLREILGRLTAVEAGTGVAVTNWGSAAIFDLLTERIKGLPQVDALMVVNADGHVANFSRAFPPVPLDASGRDYFQHLKAQDDHGLFVSGPATTFLDGRWVVFLARRMNDAHGSFAGIVVAAVTLPYLEDFYHAVAPESGSVTLLRRDGVILVRYPPEPHLTGTKMPAEAPWHDMVEAGGGSYRTPGYLTNIAGLISVRPLRDFPLIIDVGTSEAAALSEWKRHLPWLLAGAALAAACAIFLLRVFALQYDRLARQNALLETSRQQFDAVLDNMSQGLTLFDSDRNLLVCNRRFAEIYKLSWDQVRPGTSFADIVGHRVAAGSFLDMKPEDYLSRAANLVAMAEDFELIDPLGDGRSIFLHSRPMRSGGWVSTHEDITARRHAEASLTFMARHDALTELPNRMFFQERLADAIAMTQRGGSCVLMCLDLDRFKVINDTLGHSVGDGLLRAVSGRLSGAVRAGDTVARLGGDEFAIILLNLRPPEDAAVVASRFLEALREPYDIDGHRIMAGASIGISIAPRDGDCSETLLKNADVALYLAKTNGRGTFRFFKPDIDFCVQQRRTVELELRNAVPADDFELYYQPILDLASGKVSGFEALIRWNHAVRGLVSPAEFIPIAEETGLIIPIGEWALRTACLEAAGWPEDVKVAVNLSPAQFRGSQLLGVVQEALAGSGLDPVRLELEITELLLLENSADRMELLHQLRALGIRIALDDFGTGFSSLSYLRSFPFDKIKIDRAFIRDVDTDKDSAVIVGAVVTIAQALGMTTVAEGVETMEQLAKVRDQGCSKVQGYLFSRPRPASEVPGLIRTLHVEGSPRLVAGETA